MTKRRRVTYSLDAFLDAVTAYRNRTTSSIAASKKFGAPESTIRKHKDQGRRNVFESGKVQYKVVGYSSKILYIIP